MSLSAGRLALLVTLAACAAPLAAQDPITLDDVRGLSATPWLGLSPDGTRLAYVLDAPEAVPDLWVVGSEGGTPEPVTREAAVRAVAGWGPDGEELAFIAPEGDGVALWIVRPGSAPRAVCRLPPGARSPAWIGDGSRLAFAAPPETAADAAAPGEAVHACDVPTGAIAPVTRRGYHGLEFAWSPQGDRIALSHQERPGFYEGLERDILLVDAATGEELPLVARPGVDRSPLWSPDGTRVAFVSGFGRSGLLPNLGVAVVRPGDPEPRDIGAGHDRGGFFEGPSLHGWTSDGSGILYSVVDGLETPLFRVAVESGAFARVEVPVEEGRVAYQFSPSADGQALAFKASSTDRPPEIFTTRSGSTRAVRVTRLHDGFVAGGVRRAERIRWTAADGTPVEGVLLRPPESAGAGPHPLVTVLHGGPASAYNLGFPGLAFFNPYQDLLLAARGYAVLLPNPRGSGGYGERFRAAARRDWGRGPAADVHAGIDHLIAEGVADPDRLALAGWSYGGYLAAWMLAHSDRFAAGSVGAGVYDLTTHYGLGAPQLEEYFGGPPWRLPSLYREQSPIQHVGGIEAPTLLFHGEDDTAVSVAQSELLIAALRREGAPAEFVRIPGEGHSLRRPDSQDESWAAFHAWLERWLSPESGTEDGARSAPAPAREGRRPPSERAGRDDPRGAALDDVRTLDGIIRAYYDVISGPAGTAPDRERDAYLHHPDALVAIAGVRPDGTRTLQTMSLDEYHERLGSVRSAGFFEREIHRRVERFGGVAHVWSTYAASGEPEGEPFARGINSIQLYDDGTRWWITSWIFDSERPGNPIPTDYLPQER